MRSEDQLRITLSSMSLQEFANEGPSPCFALVITMRESKTNHHGKTQYSTLMRHKQVDMCPVAFLGVLLFARFQHHPEQLPRCVAPRLPNMSTRKSWYDLPLFSHKNQPAVALKYDAQAKSMRSALEECGIHTSAVTHISRKWGAQLAERGGASQADIARQGRWVTSVMENVYLSHFPLQALRVLAGFPVTQEAYYLPRDIQRGEALLVTVFPDIERCQQQLHDPNRTEKDMAGEAFIQFMLFPSPSIPAGCAPSDTGTLICTSGTTLSSRIPST